MKEIQGNIWDYFNPSKDALCITTNGIVKQDGRAVMGAGFAAEALERFKEFELDLTLGILLSRYGNQVHLLHVNPDIYSFPTKHNYINKSPIELIKKSAEELVRYTSGFQYEKILTVPPGIGQGKLKWENVKQVIAPILNEERFIVVNNGKI